MTSKKKLKRHIREWEQDYDELYTAHEKLRRELLDLRGSATRLVREVRMAGVDAPEGLSTYAVEVEERYGLDPVEEVELIARDSLHRLREGVWSSFSLAHGKTVPDDAQETAA